MNLDENEESTNTTKVDIKKIERKSI